MSTVLQIGPLCWELDQAVSYKDPVYDPFCMRREESLVTIPVSVHANALQVPDEEPLYSSGLHWSMWDEGEYITICSGFQQQECALFHCRVHRETGAIQLSLDPAREDGSRPLRYPIDQILSWGPLAQCGGMILHSAVVVKDGVGWVLSGRSGAGKTTLSELCHEAGWSVLNDDRVMVFPRDGEWRVAGTPWHGSGRFAEAVEVPLGGQFFIEQSLENEAERLAPKNVRNSLLDVAAIPWFDEKWAQGALTVADTFAHEVPIWRFKCTKTPAAVQALEKCIQGEGAK